MNSYFCQKKEDDISININKIERVLVKMNTISLDEMKKIELDILKDVVNYCNLNNIRYYLAAGTLLGAIRHKSFIPWDDDIDIVMPRPDYTKFIEGYEEFAGKDYVLTYINNNKDHLFTYAKVYDSRTEKMESGISYNANNVGGVDIDIFPLDGVPKEMTKSDMFFKQQKIWFILHSLCIQKYTKSKNPLKTIIKYLIQTACKVIGKNNLIKIINRRAMRYDFESSEFIALSVAPYYGNRERMAKINYLEQVEVQFEDGIFYAPIGYDEHLSKLYGDYMKLPPLEKRVTHHSYKAKWKDANLV